MTYWQTYRPWLVKILNQRIYLSQRGYCPELLQTAVSLKNLIVNNGYRNDEKLANFLIRKQIEIKILIPSNCAIQKQLSTLKMAIEQAESFNLSNP
jgi:hypothetical protein